MSDPPHPESSPEEPKVPGLGARAMGWFARRRDAAEDNWRFVDAEVQRGRLLTKVFLLPLRYAFGYLAFGFLVSAPIQLGWRRELAAGGHVFKSLALGLGCAIPFLLLWPFTRIAWERMRVPEFKNLELALTRWATVMAILFVVLAASVTVLFGHPKPGPDGATPVLPWWVWICDVRVAWLTLGLMFFSWIRVKFHTLLFREFYTLKAEDDLVLRVPPSQIKLDLSDPDQRPTDAPQPEADSSEEPG